MNLSEKRIVVTGGAGFLGKYVVKKLKERGCHYIFSPRSKDYDLRKEADIVEMLAYYNPNIIIHLAAVVGGIGINKRKPGTFFYDNLIMGTQLMEKSRLFGVEKFVSIGTICSYPKYTPVPFNEKNLWNGYPEETNAPYGMAKKMMIIQSDAYRQQYGFNSICLLPVNLYGPGDNFNLETAHVIPSIIRKCKEAKDNDDSSITLWGTGNITREFIYVEDAAEGIVLATEKYNESNPINIGSGHEIKIKKLAQTIKELTEYKGSIFWDDSKPDGQPRRKLDISLAKEKLGFEPKVELVPGLEKTIDWYIEHF